MTIEKRFKTKELMPYNYEIVKTIEGEALSMCELETELKKFNKNYRYIPLVEFKGKYECFSSVKIQTLINS